MSRSHFNNMADDHGEVTDPRLQWMGVRVQTSCKIKADKWRKIALLDDNRYESARALGMAERIPVRGAR